MTKNSIRYLPLNPSFHYSNTPIAKRSGAKFTSLAQISTMFETQIYDPLPPRPSGLMTEVAMVLMKRAIKKVQPR